MLCWVVCIKCAQLHANLTAETKRKSNTFVWYIARAYMKFKVAKGATATDSYGLVNLLIADCAPTAGQARLLCC